MGIIRGGAFVIASVLFFISLLITGVLWTVSLSLEYETIKPELSSVIEDVAGSEINFSETAEEMLPAIELYCENNSEFVFDNGGYAIDVPCEVAAQGGQALINETLDDIIEGVYYEDYDCEFIDCFKENLDQPFFLVSEMAKNYWENKLYVMLTISVLILIAMFFLIENKINFPFVAGPLLLVASLVFAKLDWISSLTTDGILLQIISVFFTQSPGVFWRFFIVGVLILITGIFLKFFSAGFKISAIISRFNKNKTEKPKTSGSKKPAKA